MKRRFGVAPLAMLVSLPMAPLIFAAWGGSSITESSTLSAAPSEVVASPTPWTGW